MNVYVYYFIWHIYFISMPLVFIFCFFSHFSNVSLSLLVALITTVKVIHIFQIPGKTRLSND
ncbi:hypothetical protein J3Q64DRAFT_1761880 [Phycomyces blakesleeanus]|uniref:Uncharacterized protein n=1 Tax=Phycomyces blakesleeanus TaxID=4837 RepID=A0ABR3ARW0_PHYBL